MGRPAKIVHGRAQYAKGCRCDVCRNAEAVYQKQRRTGHIAPVTDIPVKPAGPGRVEQAVCAEIEGYSGARSRFGIVEAAVSMAKVLDNPLTVAQHPSAARQLQSLLLDLRQSGNSRRSTLATVAKLAAKSG